MKKLMVAVLALLVVLLPRMVAGQEPTDNGTVPPYVVWLPVVKGNECPWEVESMYYFFGSPLSSPHYHILVVNNDSALWSDFPFPEGEYILSTNPDMNNIVSQGVLYRVEILGGFSAALSSDALKQGETYYWKARFVCTISSGSWSDLQEFQADGEGG